MKFFITLALCTLMSTSSFGSSTGTSATDQSQDLTQTVSDILSGDASKTDSRFSRCVQKHKRRCLASYSPIKCRVLLTRYCKNKPKEDRFKLCVQTNLKRCLTHYSALKCRELLTNVCSIGSDEGWDYKCVRKNAPRCVHAMLTKRECMQKLEPVCKK